MSRVKASLDHKRVRRLIWLVLTVFVLLGYSLQSVAASVYYSMVMQAYGTVSSPPVILEEGNVTGASTIYTNKTSAKVNVTAPLFDYVDNNDYDVDSSSDKGTHSNFTAQQYGPDSINDTLTEGNTGGSDETTYDYSSGAGSNKWTYKGEASSPPADGPDITGQTEVTNYTLIESSNDVRDSFGPCSPGARPYFNFKFTITESSITQLYLLFEGYPLAAGATVYLRLWNFTGSVWDTKNSTVATGGQDENFTATVTTGITDYINANDYLYFLVQDGTNKGTIYCDYVKVVVTYSVANYELDLEVQWTNADYDETNEELAIYVNKGNNTHSLDATGGYMIIGDGTPDWGSVTGTISFWIKWDSVANRSWGQHDNMETRFSGSNLVLDWGAAGSLTSTTSFTAGQWYFIAIVWNENTDDLYLYVGDQDNPPTQDTYNNAWTSTVSTVGVTQNNFMASKNGIEPTDGHGEELRYWDTDRTLAEIQSDYDTELTGSETNLRSYFKLNNNFDDIGPDNNDGSGSGSYSFSSDVPFDAPPTENIRVDAWNGTVWQNLFTNLTNGWNNVSVSSYLTSSNFTIRFKGGNETGDTTQDSWNIDATLLHVWTSEGTYDYVLQVVNQVADNWTINLQVYDNSSIARLSNTTISFHDGSSSDQIIVSGGAIAQSEGFPYNLAGNATIYISMSNVKASASGTSYLYVYLKIQVPDTSTYMLYVIPFEIT